MKTIKKVTGRCLAAAAFFIFISTGFSYAQNTGMPDSHLGPIGGYFSKAKATTETTSPSRSGVSVTPNPSTGPIVVRYFSSTGGKIGITISSANGPICVMDVIASVGNNQVAMDLSGYGAGSYAILVSGAGVFGKTSVVIK